jgi:hypothetical protein
MEYSNPIFPDARLRIRRAEPAFVAQHQEYVLRRIMLMTGQSIDDVTNSQISKNIVSGHYKLYLQIGRVCEVRELEEQWNAVKL